MPEYNTTDLTVTVKFNSTKESDKGTPEEGTAYAYQAQVAYTSVADAAKFAGRFTTWALQRRARKGELPVGKLIHVNGEGEYAKSVNELIEEMAPDKAMELFLSLQAKLFAKVDDKPAELTPEQESALEELTKPEVEVPVTKAPNKKGAGKK